MVLIGVRTGSFTKMSKSIKTCFIKHAHELSRIEIRFTYEESRLNFCRDFLFNRNTDETVGVLSNNISERVLKKMDLKIRKYEKKMNTEGLKSVFRPCVNIYKCGVRISEDALFKSLLVDDADGSIMQIGDSSYQMCINHPAVLKLKLHDYITAGFEIYPSELQLEFAEIADSVFLWQRSLPQSSSASSADGSDTEEWRDVGTELRYCSSSDDIDCRLRFSCTPVSASRRGSTVTTISDPVRAPPPCDIKPISRRHSHTRHLAPSDHLRVISYNVLADLYANSEFTRTVLHPYCPAYALTTGYRRQLLLHELIGYNGDLICLQEVDVSLFQHALNPALKRRGLSGMLHPKEAAVPEGLACFWREAKLCLVSSEHVVLAEAIFNDPLLADVATACRRSSGLETRVAKRRQILQMCVLERVKHADAGETGSAGDILLVANTHLYFHPDADHIRAVQVGSCMRLVERRLRQLRADHPGRNVDLVFCGDFNSCPQFSVHRLLTSGELPEDCADFRSAADQEVQGLQFRHALSMASACGQPAYTNHVGSFHGCLDYIFYQTDRLAVQRVVPLPSDAEVTLHTALPSVLFPSDHLALVADLAWKQTTTE